MSLAFLMIGAYASHWLYDKTDGLCAKIEQGPDFMQRWRAKRHEDKMKKVHKEMIERAIARNIRWKKFQDVYFAKQN